MRRGVAGGLRYAAALGGVVFSMVALGGTPAAVGASVSPGPSNCTTDLSGTGNGNGNVIYGDVGNCSGHGTGAGSCTTTTSGTGNGNDNIIYGDVDNCGGTGAGSCTNTTTGTGNGNNNVIYGDVHNCGGRGSGAGSCTTTTTGNGNGNGNVIYGDLTNCGGHPTGVCHHRGERNRQHHLSRPRQVRHRLRTQPIGATEAANTIPPSEQRASEPPESDSMLETAANCGESDMSSTPTGRSRSAEGI